jgi:hypothetical protein
VGVLAEWLGYQLTLSARSLGFCVHFVVRNVFGFPCAYCPLPFRWAKCRLAQTGRFDYMVIESSGMVP